MTNSFTAGHNDFKHKAVSGWGVLATSKYPVKDCHEMVTDYNKLLYMLTHHIANYILIYNHDGKLCRIRGNTYPGARRLAITNGNGTEFLFITDCERYQGIKTTLSGKEFLVPDDPKETRLYVSSQEYKPTAAVATNGEIFVTEGSGLQYVLQYNCQGEYTAHWGGKSESDDKFNCVHAITLDNRNSRDPSLLITSRNQIAWKRFTIEGIYINTNHLSGSFVCRPVIQNVNIYSAVFLSQTNQNEESRYITTLDKKDKVVSTPGDTEPIYEYGNLLPQKKGGNLFVHPHDVCQDDKGNHYTPQRNAHSTCPVKLESIK